ncbi:hypothetical protein QCM77_08315 [Bradyrhizobium sp. SSUT18]|uniref:hypothetical protein n=1 Tax=Bradyrhizobium sp. SSUT18 TaxID=3040602 RepID=UPI00244AB5D8|nr:hypothetical protein [Bradyrhizobium sp. SSUT18]MDH2399952.1 hypothetical protein [Bradyrhizobium sp. SSUT18]
MSTFDLAAMGLAIPARRDQLRVNGTRFRCSQRLLQVIEMPAALAGRNVATEVQLCDPHETGRQGDRETGFLQANLLPSTCLCSHPCANHIASMEHAQDARQNFLDRHNAKLLANQMHEECKQQTERVILISFAALNRHKLFF